MAPQRYSNLTHAFSRTCHDEDCLHMMMQCVCLTLTSLGPYMHRQSGPSGLIGTIRAANRMRRSHVTDHTQPTQPRGEAIAREPMWVLEQICQQDAAATSHRDDVLCSFLLDVTACSSRCMQPLQEGCSRLQAPTGFGFIWHPAVDLFVNIRSGIAPSPDLDPGQIRIHIRIRPLQIRIHIRSDMTVQNGFHAVGPPCSLAQGFLKYRTLTCCTAA